MPNDPKTPSPMKLNDAIAAVRKCMTKIMGGDGATLLLSTAIADALPGAPPGVPRFISCINDSTGFNLDAGAFAGKTFQDVVNALTGQG